MIDKPWRFLLSFSLVLGLTILYNFNPASTTGIYPPSLVRKFTDFYCPGCGTLRATHQFLHGNWQEALALNCLTVGFLIYFMYWLSTYLIRVCLAINLPTVTFNSHSIKAIALIVILFGILRNIPISPFSWLAPG